MMTTDTSSSASIRAGVQVFSVHERETGTRRRTRRPHYITTPTTSTEGLALCHRVILYSVTPGHPRYTGARTREGRGWPDNRAPRDKTKTTTRPRLRRPFLGNQQDLRICGLKFGPKREKPLRRKKSKYGQTGSPNSMMLES